MQGPPAPPFRRVENTVEDDRALVSRKLPDEAGESPAAFDEIQGVPGFLLALEKRDLTELPHEDGEGVIVGRSVATPGIGAGSTLFHRGGHSIEISG